MRLNNIVSVLVISSAALTGCSTVPEKNAVLDDARKLYQAAQSNPDVTKYAAVELQQAGIALENAESAWKNGKDADELNHLAYLAKQRAVIAQDTGKLKAAELELANASAERDKIRLSVRTAEAEAAIRQAAVAEQTAEQKAAEAEAARALAESEQRRQSELAAKLSQMEARLAELNAKKTDRGMVVTLGDVLFDVNKAELKPGAERNLLQIADFLKEYPERKATIEGFTDSIGSDDYNLSLSQRRAEAVRLFLMEKGISPERLEARGYGEAHPIASNDSSGTRQLNRRVEIVLSEDASAIPPR